jgi:hypothetical protein
MRREISEKRAKALEWLNLLLKSHPGMSRIKAVEETAVKFDLSPIEEEWLLRQLADSDSAKADGLIC